MIYFGHSFYDIQGNKYLKNNFETLEVQDFTNTFWNVKRGNFPEQILCFLNFKLFKDFYTRLWSLSIRKKWFGIPTGISIKYSGKSKSKFGCQ